MCAHSIKLQIGDKPAKSSFGVRVAVGKDHSTLSQDLLDKFQISETSPAIIFRLSVTDPVAAKVQFDEFWNGLMSMVDAFAPPEIAGMVKEAVKFNCEPVGNLLIIVLQVNHPLVEEMYKGQM